MTRAIVEMPSPNEGPRPDGVPIDVLVLHYTGMQSAVAAIDRLRDPEARVSSHYVVDEEGGIFRLVAEHRRAAHAGVSYWRGHEGLNDRSIGIEIVNPGHEWGYRAFPEAQLEAVEELCLAILSRHPIEARNVVGHSDIAPDRKQDPGELFPWRRLARRGIGFWPEVLDGLGDTGTVSEGLRRIGYKLNASEADAALAVVVTAFQRHWRPALVDGQLDKETRRAIGAVAPGALPLDPAGGKRPQTRTL